MQNRPYEVRLRYLKITVLIIAVILLGLWFFTIQFRNKPASDAASKFAPLWENLKKIRDPKL